MPARQLLAFGLLLGLGCPSKEQPATAPTTEPAAEIPETPDEADGHDKRAVPTQPVKTPESDRAHQATAAAMLGDEGLPDNELVTHAHVEDPSGEALDAFHAALRQLQAGKDPDRKVRISVYGASSVAADRFTAYLRRYLHERFGDAGIGFVAVVPIWRWHRHDAVLTEASKSWTIEHAQKWKTGKLDGLYGLIGASAWTTSKRGWTELKAKTKRTVSDASASELLSLYYLAQPGGGKFDVEIAGKVVGTVDTRAEEPTAAYYDVPAEKVALPLKLKTKGNGEVRLFGAVLERDQPGVVVDELGVGGTRAANHLEWNEALWSDNFLKRPPDLYIFDYGGNEAVDDDEEFAPYEDNIRKLLTRFADTVPEASCVLLGPVDFMEKLEDETWQPRERIDQITEIQRRLAGEFGCGFVEKRKISGGRGQLGAWVDAEPPLAKKDHLHLTPLGYAYLGRVLADALMAGFDAKAQ